MSDAVTPTENVARKFTREEINASPKLRVARPGGSSYLLARDSVVRVSDTTNPSWSELTIEAGDGEQKIQLLVVGHPSVLEASFPRARPSTSAGLAARGKASNGSR